MSLVCTRMSFVCHSYVLVCDPYITRMYSYVIRMSLVCHPYVTRLYSYVIRMSFVCHSYVVLPWTKRTLNIRYYITYAMFLYSRNMFWFELSLLRCLFMSCSLSFFLKNIFEQSTHVIFPLAVIQVVNFYRAFWQTVLWCGLPTEAATGGVLWKSCS